jgi:gas vesicle protein
MSEETNNNSQGIAWFLAGLGVGALIGVLYAPKSGRETREDLAQRAQDGKEYLRARSKEAAEQMGNMMDKGKDQMNQYMGRGRDLADRGRAQWQDFVERGKNLVNEKSSRVGAAIDAGREAYRANTTSAEPTEPGV